jgi:hypothetical protein
MNHDLVACRLTTQHGPVRALQGPIALNAKVAGSFVFDMSHSYPLL